MPCPFVDLFGGQRSRGLDDLYHKYKYHDRKYHYEMLVSVITVVDRNFTEASASDDTAHC